MSTHLPARFREIRTWVFDLDNTLYPPSSGLLDQVNVLMSEFIQQHLGVGEAEAVEIRQDLWLRYGTTLTGLMTEHGVEADRFLQDTHAIDLTCLPAQPDLARALDALPGRCVIHTNGPRYHAERVLSALGLSGAFEQVVTLEDTGLRPKPAREAHEDAVRLLGLNPADAVMIDDMLRNLVVPAEMGMATVWLSHGESVDHSADVEVHDLADLLARIS